MNIIIKIRISEMYYIVFALLCLIIQAHSYVLLQVRKDDQNRSNVDALIHKVVPSGEFEKIAQKIARKQFSEQKREKKRAQESFSDQKREMKRAQESEEQESKEEVKFKDTIKDIVEKKAEFRTKDFKIKPQVIHLRSDHPSLMYEVDSNMILKALKYFLSSKLVARYTDNVAKKAAVVFRSFKND